MMTGRTRTAQAGTSKFRQYMNQQKRPCFQPQLGHLSI
jgi:hypothetical protein